MIQKVFPDYTGYLLTNYSHTGNIAEPKRRMEFGTYPYDGGGNTEMKYVLFPLFSTTKKKKVTRGSLSTPLLCCSFVGVCVCVRAPTVQV